MPPASVSPEFEPPPAMVGRANVGVSLRSNVQWALIGNVVYSVCQWAILIVLAKLGTPESVGQFALGLAVTAPVMLFANLQLGALQATDARREYRFGHYLALRLVMTGLALAVIAGLALGVGYNPVTAAVVLAVGVAKAFEMISDAYHGLMQQHRRMERVAWSLMLKGAISVSAVTSWMYLDGSVIGAAIALAATWGLLFVGFDLRSPAWLRKVEPGCREEAFAPCWDWTILSKLAWQALPLGVRVVLFTLSFNIPRYFVEDYLGAEQLGIFAALAYVTVVGQVVSNSLGQAAAPRLASHYAAGEMRAFRLLVLKLASAGAVLGIGGVGLAMVAGRPILALLYKPEYAQHADLFAWIMAAAGLWCVTTMFVAAANAARRNSSQAFAGIAVVIATLGSSAVLIRSQGLGGAATACVIGGAVGVLAFGTIFLTIGKGPSESSRGHEEFAGGL
jgi:O-antigen/teichoic acid export membrane protein